MDDFEAHPAGMDSDASNGGEGGGKLLLVALLLGLVGIIFGVAGIYMAAQSGIKLESYVDSQAAAPDTTGDRLESVEARLSEITEQLASIEERLGNMGAAQVSIQRNSREMREQTQNAFEGVSREVSANRSQLNDTTSKLEELIEGLSSGAVRRGGASTNASSGGDNADTPSTPAAAPPPPEGVHVVQSGDTLSKIAARYGISLSALMAANPTVDPRRMRVGQHIVIPEQ